MTRNLLLVLIVLLALPAGAAPKGKGKAKGSPAKKPIVIIPVPATTVIVPSAEAPAAPSGPVPAAEAPSEPEPTSPKAPAQVETPAPRKAPERTPSPGATPEDLAKLRAEYDELRDALFRSQARAQTVENALFSTRLTASLRWKAGKHYPLRRAIVKLDDTLLWDSGEKPTTDGVIKAGERSVAPGRHRLTVRLDVRSREDGELGYISEQTFALTLPEGKHTDVEITADEDGDLPEYEPVFELELRSRK